MGALSTTRVNTGASSLNWRSGVGILVAGLLLSGCVGNAGSRVIDEVPRESLMRPGDDAAPRVEEQSANPVRVRVPAISVDAAIHPLSVDRQGVLQPPSGNDITGWWKAGPEPGEKDPSVIAGHVDSSQGPAVFFRLAEIRAGDTLFVDRVDGTTAAFTTYKVERHPKDSFPTEAVYGSTPGSELRLITCGGSFDEAGGRYLANVIVFATRSS